MNYPMDFAKICVILMLSLSSECECTKQVGHSVLRNSRNSFLEHYCTTIRNISVVLGRFIGLVSGECCMQE